MRTMIEADADVNKAMDNGATPPFISAQNGHEAIVRSADRSGRGRVV